MPTITVYCYNRDTNVFIGTSTCRNNPEEEGKWLVPAYATLTPVPTVSETEQARWDGNTWIIEPKPLPPTPPEPTRDEKIAALTLFYSEKLQKAVFDWAYAYLNDEGTATIGAAKAQFKALKQEFLAELAKL